MVPVRNFYFLLYSIIKENHYNLNSHLIEAPLRKEVWTKPDSHIS